MSSPTCELDRRQFLARAALFAGGKPPVKGIVISVLVMFDRGAHKAHGLSPRERATFKLYQDQASREFATSGIVFDLHFTEDAFVRDEGYSEIPEKFLVKNAINLLVTDRLGYDIDKERTGGCSFGPQPISKMSGGNPYYTTFLGLNDASAKTLLHEYAHHFTLDTQKKPKSGGNSWADIRNNYWLWRQRHGSPIPEFRACANLKWARFQ
jgi:hypothetical protein